MERRSWTISAIRGTGTRNARASAFILRSRGSMKSSRRTSPGWIGGSLLERRAAGRFLVVVDDFNIVCVSFPPDKTDAPLIVDADAVLPPTFATQGLEAITGR